MASGDQIEGVAPAGLLTMAQAAVRKGVGYQTVARAVKAGRLPARRVGRMFFLDPADLDRWTPHHDRAPLRHRRTPGASPLPADPLASRAQIASARDLAALHDLLATQALNQPLADYLPLLLERFAAVLGLTRAAVWRVDMQEGAIRQEAGWGDGIEVYPRQVSFAQVPSLVADFDLDEATHVSVSLPWNVNAAGNAPDMIPVIVAPFRGSRVIHGCLLGDRDGQRFTLTPQELELAQAFANHASLALDRSLLDETDTLISSQFALMVEHILEPAFGIDPELNVVIANQAAVSFLGLAAGSSLYELMNRFTVTTPDGRPVALEDLPLSHALRGRQVSREPLVVVLPGRPPQAIDVTAFPVVPSPGEIAGAVVLVHTLVDTPAPPAAPAPPPAGATESA